MSFRTRTIRLKRSIHDIFNSGKSENHDENYNQESQKEKTSRDNFAKHVKFENESQKEEFNMIQHYKNFAERVELENHQMFKFIKTCIKKDI